MVNLYRAAQQGRFCLADGLGEIANRRYSLWFLGFGCWDFAQPDFSSPESINIGRLHSHRLVHHEIQHLTCHPSVYRQFRSYLRQDRLLTENGNYTVYLTKPAVHSFFPATRDTANRIF